MQSGELIVTGQNELSIPLKKCPSEIRVYFKDNFEMTPCNASNADSLEYETHESHEHHRHTLIIKWNVSGAREIRWHVGY
jgi:hypothetical protein